MNGNDRLRRIVALGAVLFAVPVLGWLTSVYVETSHEKQFRRMVMTDNAMTAEQYAGRNLSYLGVCRKGGELQSSGGGQAFCQFAGEIELTRTVALGTAALGAVLLLIIFASSRAAGADRRRLSLVFNPTVRIVMLLLAVSMIAQAGLFIYSVYTLEVAAIHTVHAGLLVVVGIGAVIGCLQLLKISFGFLRIPPLVLRGRLLAPDQNPKVFEVVRAVADRLAAQMPDHIVVTLEPNFFVTSSHVMLIGESADLIHGRTLCLSFSLLRILDVKELKAVVGHELGHFRGEDTEYSLKFAPIYARLTTALEKMTGVEGSAQLATLPAIAVLSVCLSEFASLERTVGRERELLADKAGVEAASALALAAALIKVSVYSALWNALYERQIAFLSEGQSYANLSETYRYACEHAFSTLDWDNARASFDEYIQPHPVDTHPPMSQRLLALGYPASSLSIEVAKPSEDPAILLLSGTEVMEQDLTNLENQYLVAIKAVTLPEAHDPQATVKY